MRKMIAMITQAMAFGGAIIILLMLLAMVIVFGAVLLGHDDITSTERE